MKSRSAEIQTGATADATSGCVRRVNAFDAFLTDTSVLNEAS